MKQTLFILTLIGLCAIISGCANLAPAPIEDGSYLTYEFAQPNPFQGGKTSYRFTIKFTETESGMFEVTVDFVDNAYAYEIIKPHKKDGKVMVNQAMRRRDGKELLLENIGPLWVPTSSQQEGTRKGVDFVFFGTTSDEIKQWKKWQVYVVNASVFRGAISGSWFYDTKTGFLAGFTQKTAGMFDYEAPTVTLIDSNIENL